MLYKKIRDSSSFQKPRPAILFLFQKTYYRFSMFLAVLFVIGISMPPALLAGSCEQDMQDMSTNTISEKCCHITGSQFAVCGSGFSSHNSPNGSCGWILSGFCDFDQPKINADAISSINRTAKMLAVPVIQFIDLEPTTTHTFFTDAELEQHSKTPPLFLLNNVFLN